jgi:hypothetical protein
MDVLLDLERRFGALIPDCEFVIVTTDTPNEVRDLWSAGRRPEHHSGEAASPPDELELKWRMERGVSDCLGTRDGGRAEPIPYGIQSSGLASLQGYTPRSYYGTLRYCTASPTVPAVPYIFATYSSRERLARQPQCVHRPSPPFASPRHRVHCSRVSRFMCYPRPFPITIVHGARPIRG